MCAQSDGILHHSQPPPLAQSSSRKACKPRKAAMPHNAIQPATAILPDSANKLDGVNRPDNAANPDKAIKTAHAVRPDSAARPDKPATNATTPCNPSRPDMAGLDCDCKRIAIIIWIARVPGWTDVLRFIDLKQTLPHKRRMRALKCCGLSFKASSSSTIHRLVAAFWGLPSSQSLPTSMHCLQQVRCIFRAATSLAF